MRGMIIGTAVLIALTGGAEAAKVRFEGAAVITSKSGTCSDWNPVGARYHVRYRPAGVGDNGSASSFSFFQLNGAMGFAVSGKFTTAFKTVTYAAVYDGPSLGDPAVKVKFATHSPSTVTTGTQFIDVTGSIQNFDQMSGCTVNFSMGLVRRLE